jgi:REP element-mobilizing transposase RayT
MVAETDKNGSAQMRHRQYSSTGWYHVYNRGIRRSDVFQSHLDRGMFLADLAETCERLDVECHGFCLMNNHYHLLLHAPALVVSAAVQRFTSRYVRKFNVRHGYDGPLFKSRFGSTAIESSEHLLEEIRYIHNNPLDLGEHPDRYRWSSHLVYLKLRPRPDFLTTSTVLDYFGQNVDEYARFIAKTNQVTPPS